MAFSDKQLRTIKCDNPGCDKEVEFDIRDVKAIQAITWLTGVRVVQTGDNRNFSYCSDICEVKGITTGQHNLKEVPKVAAPEAPKVIESATDADVKAAAAAQKNADQVTEALKEGRIGEVTIK